MRAFLLAAILVVTHAAAGAAEVESRCAGMKLKAAAVAARWKVGCHVQATKAGRAVEPGCLERADELLAKRWAAAERSADCLTRDDLTAGRKSVDDFVQDLIHRIDPARPVCCEQGSACMYFEEADECVSFLGTPAPTGAVCDAATGTCRVGRASDLGWCCDLRPPNYVGISHDFCAAGPEIWNCSDVGGTDVYNATCLPNGRCGVP